jgi:hypothetical protein
MTTPIPGWDYNSGGAEVLSIEVPDAGSRSDPGPGPGGRLPEQIPVRSLPDAPGRPVPPPPATQVPEFSGG